eukprot:m.135160 g.135160  ORF g.135160 m.135160 type:complete len:343 (+) comp9857_c0_seq1:48-1076(+)
MSKWLNKRTQAVTEKLSGSAKRTQYEADFEELTQSCEATKNVLQKLLKEAPSYLHPNPAARAKTSMGSTIAKMRKIAAEKRYPHAIGDVADIMIKGANEMPPVSSFGLALREVGETLQALTEAQHNFDAEVVQNFLEPIRDLMDNDFKELAKNKKKLEGRRLQFDFKQRKREQGKTSVTDADIKLAEEKFQDSKDTTENTMLKIVNNDVEQVGQLSALVEAMLTLSRTQVEALEAVQESLASIVEDADTKPKREARPVSTVQYDDDDEEPPSSDDDEEVEGGADEKACIAVFDFEAENEGELSFKEGQKIKIIQRLDENWLEGEIDGRSGMFPDNYVEVINE